MQWNEIYYIVGHFLCECTGINGEMVYTSRSIQYYEHALQYDTVRKVLPFLLNDALEFLREGYNLPTQ